MAAGALAFTKTSTFVIVYPMHLRDGPSMSGITKRRSNEDVLSLLLVPGRFPELCYRKSFHATPPLKVLAFVWPWQRGLFLAAREAYSMEGCSR